LFTPGFAGWFTCAPSVFDSIRNHRFSRDRMPVVKAEIETGADQVSRNPTPGQRRWTSQPPLKCRKHEVSSAAILSSSDDSSSDSWPSVQSSDSEVANATDKLAKVSLDPPPQAVGEAAAVVDDNPDKWMCMNPVCGLEDVRCPKCQQWKFREFATYRDVPQRVPPRGGYKYRQDQQPGTCDAPDCKGCGNEVISPCRNCNLRFCALCQENGWKIGITCVCGNRPVTSE
jgi:hypothetical protein